METERLDKKPLTLLGYDLSDSESKYLETISPAERIFELNWIRSRSYANNKNPSAKVNAKANYRLGWEAGQQVMKEKSNGQN